MGFAKAADGFYTATPTAGWQDGFRTGAPATNVTMIIFVSSVSGKDSSADGTFNAAIEGSFAQPYKTLAKAYTRTGGAGSVRNGSPDWILLATGETWTNQIGPYFFGAGLDEQNRMIFSSYDKTAVVSVPNNPPIPNPPTGTVARPIVKTPIGNNSGLAYIYSNTAVLGVDFYAYTRDTVANPANASNPDPGSGISMPNGDACANLLIEDCVFRWFSDGLTVDGGTVVSLRRNIIYNNWGDKYAIGSGSDMGTLVFLIEENLLYQNGWDPIGQPAGDSLAHNWYLNGNYTVGAGQGTFLTNLTAHGNISGETLFQDNNRCGGHYNNNLWRLGGTGGTKIDGVGAGGTGSPATPYGNGVNGPAAATDGTNAPATSSTSVPTVSGSLNVSSSMNWTLS